MRPIRTLVADDEPLARELAGNLVRRNPALELVGSAATGAETLRAVAELSPDLLLLDIEMPNLDGIAVAEAIARSKPQPYVIFVTAHDEFALKAFEVSARDYLVKPVSKRRFAQAIQRARHEIVERIPNARQPAIDPVLVRSGEELVSLLPDDVIWVGAANQYVNVHTTGGRDYVVAQSLRQFGQSLPGDGFARIHRSTLVNKRHLEAVLASDGRYRVRMSDGTTHDVARNRKPLLAELLTAARENTRT